MEHLYIIVSRDKRGKYRPCEVFTDKRLADNCAEIKRELDGEPKWDFFVIEGIVPETREV